MTAAARPLGRIVALRIVLFAALAMLAQLAAVLWEYGSDPDNLARLILEQETATLAQGLTLRGTALSYALPPALAERYGTPGSGYVARVRTAAGAVLFSHCDAACTAHFLPLDVNPPSFWLRRTAQGYPISLAGGRTVDIGHHTAFIEVAIDRDPEHAVWSVLASEVLAHMLVPMSLTLIFVLGATLLSIRSALRPVAATAAAAEHLDPLRPGVRLDAAGTPLEIAQLIGAVNRSLARTADLVTAQKLFTSAIAHEIRTPLAVIRLELERIDHPAARRATAELDELTRFVDQLVMLARLEAMGDTAFDTVRLDTLLADLVAAIAPWVYANGCTIAFEPSDDPLVRGNAGLLRDAVRNLVENAVRHAGQGVAISVVSEPGPVIAVLDDGSGFAPRASSAAPGFFKQPGGLGIGLEIVRRIASLHGATLDITLRDPHGTAARIRLPAQ